MAKDSGDLASQAKNTGDRMRSKAAALMEPGFMGMAAATMAKKRTQPAPAQQANAAQKNRQNGSPSAQPTPYKKGGKVHDDAAEDKKLFGKLYAAAEKKEPKGMKKGGKWIAGAVKKPGALHRELGVPMGEKIPKGKIDKAANSSNPMLAKRANFAKTVSKFANGGAVPRGKVAKFAAGGTSVKTVAPVGGVAPTGRPMPTGPVIETRRPPAYLTPPTGRPVAPSTAPQRTGFAPGQGPMAETNSPDPAANARAAALNAQRSNPPVPVGRSMPPAPVAPMPAARAPTTPTADPRGVASGIQGAAAASGIPAAGGVAGVPPRPYAMGGAAKIRKDVMTPAGKPIAQPKRGNPAWK